MGFAGGLGLGARCGPGLDRWCNCHRLTGHALDHPRSIATRWLLIGGAEPEPTTRDAEQYLPIPAPTMAVPEGLVTRHFGDSTVVGILVTGCVWRRLALGEQKQAPNQNRSAQHQQTPIPKMA